MRIRGEHREKLLAKIGRRGVEPGSSPVHEVRHEPLHIRAGKLRHALQLLRRENGVGSQIAQDPREVRRRRSRDDRLDIHARERAREVDVHARQAQAGHVEAREVEPLGERRRIERERAAQRRLVHREQTLEVHAALGLLLQRGEALAREHIDLGVGELLPHDLGIRGAVHEGAREFRRVGDALGERGGLGGGAGLHHAHDAQVEAALHLLRHIIRVVGHVGPAACLVVLAIRVDRAQDLETRPERIVVGEIDIRLGYLDLARAAHRAFHHGVELGGVEHADAVEGVVGDLAAAREHEHAFVRGARPPTGHHVVLLVEQIGVVDHLGEGRGVSHAGAGHGRGARAARHGGAHGVGRQPHRAARGVRAVHERRDAVVVLHGRHLVLAPRDLAVDIILETRHVVRLHAGEHVGEHREHRDLVV